VHWLIFRRFGERFFDFEDRRKPILALFGTIFSLLVWRSAASPLT
jgi:hypothetical protein